MLHWRYLATNGDLTRILSVDTVETRRLDEIR